MEGARRGGRLADILRGRPGTPSSRAHCVPHCLPQERIVAKDALEHPYFANLDKATVGTIPLPI